MTMTVVQDERGNYASGGVVSGYADTGEDANERVKRVLEAHRVPRT